MSRGSADAGNLPPQTCSRSYRFRNWILAQAFLYTALISVFLPLLMTGPYLSFFIAGMVIATLVFFLSGDRLWRQYNDVLVTGRLEESETKRSVILYLVISTVLLLICFEMLVYFGIISGTDFLIVPAFMTGLSIIPWYVLLLVVLWESRSGCRLYIDRKGEHTTIFVSRS